MVASVNAEIKEVWIILECPHCLKPLTQRKVVRNNKVLFMEYKWEAVCKHCDETYHVQPLLEKDKRTIEI